VARTREPRSGREAKIIQRRPHQEADPAPGRPSDLENEQRDCHAGRGDRNVSRGFNRNFHVPTSPLPLDDHPSR
jgi:hypothetical protein